MSQGKDLSFRGRRISTWKQFSRHVRSRGCSLLQKLGEYRNSILVTGCQRSGTTALARIITNSDRMTNYRFGKDDELDAALLLSGAARKREGGRYCFQTTYLNECYREYLDHRGSYRLVWLMRTPHSVVYSLVYNWRRFALNELFRACGAPLLTQAEANSYCRFGAFAVSPFRRACLSYIGKLQQLSVLHKELQSKAIFVVDYDDLVQRKEIVLPKIYDFLDLPYSTDYARGLHGRSLRKRDALSFEKKREIEQVCMPAYQHAASFLSIGSISA